MDAENTKKIRELIHEDEEACAFLESYEAGQTLRKIDVTHDRYLLLSAVLTAQAYFSKKGYVLAYELLSHARGNEELDSQYDPLNKDVIFSSQKFVALHQSALESGTASFEHEDSDDLYYSIHGFEYHRSSSGRCVVLSDRYDYAISDAPNIEGIAVNTMVLAQAYGILTPYLLDIAHNDSTYPVRQGKTIFTWTKARREFDQLCCIGSGENVEFDFTLPLAHGVLFQTFGFLNARLRLFDGSGNLLASDSSCGYGNNAMIMRHLQASSYRILVSFDDAGFGNVVFMAHFFSGFSKNGSDTISAFGDIKSIDSKTKEFSASIVQYAPRVLNFVPAESKIYTVDCQSSFDNYLYFIDPRKARDFQNGKDYDATAAVL